MDLNKLIQGFKATKQQVANQAYNHLVAMGVPASVAAVIAELVIGVVMMFVGLFMIDAVFNATAINNSSSFYGISTSLVSTTGTVFSVLGLVIIIVALATGVGSLKNMF